MEKAKFYVMKDDLRVSDGFDNLEDAKEYASDLRDSQRAMLLATRKILKLFRKGVPLNLSHYYIIVLCEEVHK